MAQNRSNIVLIGMPGCGKSAIGTLLAQAASMSYLDTDHLIQASTGRTLQEIVDRDGPLGLRRIEEQVLCSLDCRDHVIATGGSAVYSEPGMQHLKTLGAIVFLKVDLETLRARIQDYDTRGLVKAPGQTLEDLFNERAALYNRYAEVTIESAGLTEREACTVILETLRERRLVRCHFCAEEHLARLFPPSA